MTWDALYETAASQDGLFTTAQAAEAGYSSQALQRHVSGSGKIHRVLRGVYRLTHYPPGDHEQLIAFWLWSNRVGVFSHETALQLHGLSDALPSVATLTVPEAWRQRRLRVPEGLRLNQRDLVATEKTWIGAVAVTTRFRTLVDCINDHVAPELIDQALEQAEGRIPPEQLAQLRAMRP